MHYDHAAGYNYNWRYRDEAPLAIGDLPIRWRRALEMVAGNIRPGRDMTGARNEGEQVAAGLGAREVGRQFLADHEAFGDGLRSFEVAEVAEVRSVMRDRGDAQFAIDNIRLAIRAAARAHHAGDGDGDAFDIAIYDIHVYCRQAAELLIRYHAALDAARRRREA